MRVVSPVMPINLLRDLAPDAKVTWRRGRQSIRRSMRRVLHWPHRSPGLRAYFEGWTVWCVRQGFNGVATAFGGQSNAEQERRVLYSPGRG